jgi:predicted ATPase
VQSLIGSADYTLAFFCEPVGDYRASRVRHEDAEEARRTHEFLVEAYEESAITLVHLPAASIERRILLLKQALKKLTPA